MAETRFFVQAMHTPSNGFDSQRTVEYWRVTDRESGMRADGTAKYGTPEQAQRWCNGLNVSAALVLVGGNDPERPSCWFCDKDQPDEGDQLSEVAYQGRVVLACKNCGTD